MRSRISIFLCVSAMVIPIVVPATLSNAQVIGTCEQSNSAAYLEANNVQALIPNTGILFEHYTGRSTYPRAYQIPRFLGLHSAESGSLWIAGKVGGQVRIAATRYGRNEFWSGPLDENGNPPLDCSQYDRIYSVFASDVEGYEATGEAIPTLADWPTGLGAPTLDADGNPIDLMEQPLSAREYRTIDLSAGERPDLAGDQDVWWIMNDMGNVHDINEAPPVGMEVHGHAYAVSSTQAAIGNSTMYRYRMFYRGRSRIDSLYIGFWLDASIGPESDDYMGSDSLLGMAYMYNSDSLDSGSRGYGLTPPAVGVILLEGPLADSDGLDNNRNGVIDEIGERAHVAHIIDETDDIWDARTAETRYNRLKGRWPWGQRMTPTGRGCCEPGAPVNYIYPGDPVKGEYWSMMNRDNTGISRYTKAQAFLVSVGPMALEPDSEIDLTFAIVWARGEDHLDSITELRKAVVELQQTFDDGFANILRGEAPVETVDLLAPADGMESQSTDPMLHWTLDSTADAYEIQVWSPDTTLTKQSLIPSVQLVNLDESTPYHWRVRSINTFGTAPWSEVWTFRTGNTSFQGLFPIISAFEVVQNAGGALDPPDMAAYSFSSSGFPPVPCPMDQDNLCDRPTVGYQQSTNSSEWGIHAGGSNKWYGPISDSLSFLGRVTRMGDNLEAISSDDYEIRFSDIPGNAFVRGSMNTIEVPFEIWNIGESTPNDPSDDFRMIPVICESACGAGTIDGIFDIGGDHLISGGRNDPYTDYFSWFEPEEVSAGTAGYEAVFSGSASIAAEVFSDMVLVGRNGGSEPPYENPLPEPGTVFRISSAHDPAPILAAPGTEQELLRGTVRFFWKGAFHDLYRMQVANSQAFATPIIDSQVLAQNLDISIESTGTYYWRVKGVRSTWSEVGTFSIVDSLSQNPVVEPPDAYSVSIYPNPVREKATIVFDLPATNLVEIELYDLLGRWVKSILNKEMGPGTHRIPIDASSMASGIYFYRLEAGDFSRTRKIVVVR